MDKDTRNYHTLSNIEEALRTFRERNRTYGNNYRNFGRVCMALFGDKPLTLETENDWTRFGLLIMILSKLTRYIADPHHGHHDSMHDLGVYSFMLEEIDAMCSGWDTDTPTEQANLFAGECGHERVYRNNPVPVCCDCGEEVPTILKANLVFDGGPCSDVAECEHVYLEGMCRACGAMAPIPVPPVMERGYRGQGKEPHLQHQWDTASCQDYSRCIICKITYKEWLEATR